MPILRPRRSDSLTRLDTNLAKIKYLPNYSKLLKTVDQGNSYTCTEDCIATGFIASKYTSVDYVYINDIEVCRIYNGSNGNYNTPVYFLLAKGDVIRTTANSLSGGYLKIFALK